MELVEAARNAGVSVKHYTPRGGEAPAAVDARLSAFLRDLFRC